MCVPHFWKLKGTRKNISTSLMIDMMIMHEIKTFAPYNIDNHFSCHEIIQLFWEFYSTTTEQTIWLSPRTWNDTKRNLCKSHILCICLWCFRDIIAITNSIVFSSFSQHFHRIQVIVDVWRVSQLLENHCK